MVQGLSDSGTPEIGICPLCEAQGAVGAPCDAEVCQRRGYHFVPRDPRAGGVDLDGGDADPLIGRCIEDYLVVRHLGSGGFGRVYLALQVPLLRPVAIKLMTPVSDDDERHRSHLRRFEAEARSLARLNHPNIVQLHRYGIFRERPFLVMEYVSEARTLTREIEARRGRHPMFSVDELRRLLWQLLDALGVAHEAGIVHRDLKPDNILLQRIRGRDDWVRVLDFGLAKFIDEGRSTSRIVGTPLFIAPEQLAADESGPWSDIYSLGLLTVILLSGQNPFAEMSLDRIVAAKLSQKGDPLRDLGWTGLGVELRGVLGRAVARDPNRRYRDVEELRRALDSVLIEGRITPTRRTLEDASTEIVDPKRVDPPIAATDRALATVEPPILEADTLAEVGLVLAGSESVLAGSGSKPTAGSALTTGGWGERIGLSGATHSAYLSLATPPRRRRRFVPFALVTLALGAAALLAIVWPGAPRTPGTHVQRPASEPRLPAPPFRVDLGGPGGDRLYGIVPDGDGLLLAGYSEPLGRPRSGWLVWLDRHGVVKRQRRFEGTTPREILALAAAPKGGALAVGYRVEGAARLEHAWVERLDAAGRTLWSKTYGGAHHDRATVALALRDGRFLVAGHQRSKSVGWAFLLDATGALVWERTFPSPLGTAVLTCGAIARDGGLLLGGYHRVTSAHYRDTWLLKLSASGTVLWQRTLGDGWQNKAFAIATPRDGAILLTGYRRELGSKHKSIWFARLDGSGRLLAQRTYFFRYQAVGQALFVTPTGFTIAATLVGRGVRLLRLDRAGNLLQERNYFANAAELFAATRIGARRILVGVHRTSARAPEDAFLLAVDDRLEALAWR
ncbi:MAG: serine/threonine protein kinase [Myxococcales bacterium]|nr:serine/threonine protein kinase [Myxococcales bacterium]